MAPGDAGPRLQPYLMPDGRPLGAFIDASVARPPHRGSRRRGVAERRRRVDRLPGWSSGASVAAAAAAVDGGGGAAPAPPPTTLAEAAELEALRRAGQRRQRRWLNEKLLRVLGPPLTARDMLAQFSPPPFGGEPRATAFELAARPEHAAVWDLFRAVDADKQARVLERWEQHVRELRRGPSAAAAAAPPAAPPPPRAHAAAAGEVAAALAAWAAVPPAARRALRRAPRGAVDDIEAALAPLKPAARAAPGARLALAPPAGAAGGGGAYWRLLVHGLCAFHGLRAGGGGAVGEGLTVRAAGGRAPGTLACADVLGALDGAEAGGPPPAAALADALAAVELGGGVLVAAH